MKGPVDFGKGQGWEAVSENLEPLQSLLIRVFGRDNFESGILLTEASWFS